MKRLIYYTLQSLGWPFEIRLVRFIIGGTWYKQSMSGDLPGCYGSWWTQKPLKPHRYHYISEIENY